ncbi:DUF4349 domain-containing protein [Halomonas organivorans]|uniref:DUF4349 domain-containing protein n=1 Tax=Halomonas organivorans TaxID=257772 RepID=A0A7W5BX90_9GAMM|nr:DUF4349 domain-containing protein [Halomonas organivorans]MBB3140499.1 hypothetical protein [Halomonas organivorans]
MPAFLRRRRLPLLALGLTWALAGCDGPAPQDATRSASFEASRFPSEALVSQAPKMEAGRAAVPDAADGTSDARIEERRAYRLQFEAAEPLIDAYRQIQAACIDAEGCRVEHDRLDTPRHGLASGDLGLRIDRATLEDAEPLRLISESPALSGAEITREDRTQQIIDLEARLSQQVVLRERLTELAQEGREFSERRIQDLLQVERELARVQGEIESMQGRQRHLALVTDSVAIAASFQEQRWVEPHQHGVLAPLWRALDRSASLFFESLGQVILVVVFLTPWLVLGLPVLWLLSRLWRPLRRGLGRMKARRRTRRRASEEDGTSGRG